MAAAKGNVPRGFRENYKPSWSPECEDLWKQYNETGDSEIGARILKTLNEERNARWKTMTELMDFKRSSKKAWDLLKKLSGGSLIVNKNTIVTPNQIATKLQASAQMPTKMNVIRRINRHLKKARKGIKDSPYGYSVTAEEVNAAILKLKHGKPAESTTFFQNFSSTWATERNFG